VLDDLNRVILCRHGRTRLNAEAVLRGRLDPPLDDVGRAEAEELARMLPPMQTRTVLSSPLGRAVQTAQAIASQLDATVVTDSRLIDRDYGDWAGHPLSEVVAMHGSIDAAPGVEPLATVAARARSILDEQVGVVAHSHVIMVSHDAVLKTLLASLDRCLGPIDSIGQHTACWNSLIRLEQQWHVEFVNRRTAPPWS
jgi:broad specificity phosphatase PhoE